MSWYSDYLDQKHGKLELVKDEKEIKESLDYKRETPQERESDVDLAITLVNEHMEAIKAILNEVKGKKK